MSLVRIVVFCVLLLRIPTMFSLVVFWPSWLGDVLGPGWVLLGPLTLLPSSACFPLGSRAKPNGFFGWGLQRFVGRYGLLGTNSLLSMSSLTSLLIFSLKCVPSCNSGYYWLRSLIGAHWRCWLLRFGRLLLHYHHKKLMPWHILGASFGVGVGCWLCACFVEFMLACVPWTYLGCVP